MATRISYQDDGTIVRNGVAVGRLWITNHTHTIYGPSPRKDVYHAEIAGQQFAGRWTAVKAWVKAQA